MPEVPLKPPIFVCADDDLLIFLSKEEAESAIEPVDVQGDERAYDAEGRLLRVVVRGEVRHGPLGGVDQHRARVELLALEQDPNHAEDLRAVLAEWLRGSRPADSGVRAASLQTLVEEAAKLARRSMAEADRRSEKIGWVLAALAAAVGLSLWVLR